MPALELTGRYRKVVIWDRLYYDNYNRPLLDAPRELVVRWDDYAKEVIGPQGTPVAVDVELITAEQLIIGSILWKGALAELPDAPTGLRQVVTTGTTDEIRGQRNQQYFATAMRYGDTLPDLAGT